MKQHLAGVKGQVASCTSSPEDVRLEMRTYLEEQESAKQLRQVYRDERIAARTTLSKSSSVRGSTSNPEDCIQGTLDKYFVNVEDVPPTRGSVDHRMNINEKRERVHRSIAAAFYELGAPLHWIEKEVFIAALRDVGNYGPGYKPPSRHDLSTSLLEKEVKETNLSVDEIKKTWPQTGVSILSDGWKDQRGRTLVNFVVNNPYGNVFLKSVDVSNFVKDANCIFQMLDEIVEEVGVKLVIQVVTDNAANYKKAGELLMEKRQRLWWTPCAAHCLDLILEKIGHLPQHRNALRKAKQVTSFVYNHSMALSLLRKFSDKDLIRPAATRFATGFLTLQRLFEVRPKLEQMFTSTEWVECSLSNKPEGKEVKKIVVRDERFWESVSYALKTTEPLVKVLRIADSEKMPGMGFIYGAMDEAKEEIARNLDNDLASYREIWDIIDQRWQFQMHRDLHAAAYYLNPRFQYSSNVSSHPEIRIGLSKCMMKLIPSKEDQERQ